ncbi:MAG: DUF4173 domain-containing protein [Actinomycetota bacterium]
MSDQAAGGDEPPIGEPTTADVSAPTSTADLPPPSRWPDPETRQAAAAERIDPPPPRIPTSLRPAWVAAAVAAAVAVDVGLRRAPWNNVAGTTMVTVVAAGLLASGFIRTGTSRVMLAGSVFFGLFLSIRTEPRLSVFNALATLALLVLAAVHGQGRPFWDLRPLRVLSDGGALAMEGFGGLVEVPAEAAARYRVIKERSEVHGNGTLQAVMRGLMIAAPLVLVLGLLLASADAVFQSFFTGFSGPDLGVIAGHVFLAAVGAYTMMVLLRLAATQGGTDPIQRALSLGHIEAGVVLGAVNLLFAAFAVAQLMTVLGGAEDALERAGLDPKQFARQGFFQLLWVAGITLVLLMALHAATVENETSRKVNRLLSLPTIALTLLIVTVAFTRIAYYIDDNGMTPLRFYSAIFSLWVGLAFLITAIRIWGVRLRQAWLLPVLLMTGLATLAGLNLANPERIIAIDNIERDHDPLYYHVLEGQFSGDGQAVLATEFDRLSPGLADQVRQPLCNQYRGTDYDDRLLNFNLGKWRAEQSVPDLCGS